MSDQLHFYATKGSKLISENYTFSVSNTFSTSVLTGLTPFCVGRSKYGKDMRVPSSIFRDHSRKDFQDGSTASMANYI